MPRKKNIRRELRRPLETAGFILCRAAVPLFPRRMVVGLCRLAGQVAWWLPLREKTIGMKNLDAVFGDTKTRAEKRRILTRSLATFCQTMMDVFWFSAHPVRRIGKYVDLDESFKQVYEDRAQICITAHFGSWEIMGQTAALQGIDLASIAATIKNRQVDDLFCRMREKTGQTIIPRKGALRSMIHRLRNRQKAAFVLDQNTRESEGGIIVDFLGLPTPVSPAPATLAYRTGTEVFFAFCLPCPGGRYRLYSTGSLQPPPFDKAADADATIRELTQRIQDKVSEEILQHPEFWLWSYKHWRRQDGKTYPENYPIY